MTRRKDASASFADERSPSGFFECWWSLPLQVHHLGVTNRGAATVAGDASLFFSYHRVIL
jgi:hypothetical protein